MTENITEIRGLKLSRSKLFIRYLGDRDTRFGRLARKLYWKVSGKYLWGVLNWCIDFDKTIVDP